MSTAPRHSVLLVDDEEVYRDTLAKILGRRGFSVVVASSGREAVDRLGAGTPDAVVLDLKMPGLDGLQTLKLIREISPDVPVVFLTGHGTVDAGIRALAGSAADFLLKPAPIEHLVTVLLAAISAATSGRAG